MQSFNFEFIAYCGQGYEHLSSFYTVAAADYDAAMAAALAMHDGRAWDSVYCNAC